MKFLKNSWYCAGWSSELDEGPKGITMLEEYIVIYRDSSGKAVAMTGRCPHRFAPLDQGQVIADDIMCPYHGLTFNRDGECILNPHGQGIIPPNAKLKTYPVEEKNTAIWVWMGDPELADTDLLPPETALVSSDYSSKTMSLNLPCNYQLIIDNLLDLTHAPFLHRGSLAAEADDMTEIISPDFDFKHEGDKLISNYSMPAAPPTPQLQSLFKDPLGAFNAKMIWMPASILFLDITMSPINGSETPEIIMPSTHYLTPQDAETTHYFTSVARNLEIDSPELDEEMVGFVKKAFLEEDEPMIAACQDLMGGELDLFALKPAILETDRAGVLARKILSSKIKAEA
jgi:vanillate O-demethylase monooxygenase subunit